VDHFGQRELLDDLLNRIGRYEIFQTLGAGFRVESLSVNGSNGLFYGAINDLLLNRYATDMPPPTKNSPIS